MFWIIFWHAAPSYVIHLDVATYAWLIPFPIALSTLTSKQTGTNFSLTPIWQRLCTHLYKSSYFISNKYNIILKFVLQLSFMAFLLMTPIKIVLHLVCLIGNSVLFVEDIRSFDRYLWLNITIEKYMLSLVLHGIMTCIYLTLYLDP